MKAQNRQRSTRTTVTEDRCVVCGTWTRRNGSRPRVTDSTKCRTQLMRLKRRGEMPRYAAKDPP